MSDHAAPSPRKAQDVKATLDTNRQAVIVIHGIGHQRPMDTLRPFVDAVLGVDPSREQVPLYYSKPDDASATFELRRLQSRDSRPPHARVAALPRAARPARPSAPRGARRRGGCGENANRCDAR